MVNTTPETIDALTQAVIQKLFVPIEASGRHVHLTQAQAKTLFGHDLTPERPLSQPGQYLCKERVQVKGPKGTLENVAVLGPARKEAQVEISLTDSRVLGLKIPVRLSGSTEGSPGAVLVGEIGEVSLSRGVIAAQRHIHLTPGDACKFGVTDGQSVSLQTFTHRPVVFGEVIVRISPKFQSAVHLDYDEANACGFQNGDFGRILP